MKNTPQSFWLSAANTAAGWWMGHAANAVRAQQRAMLAGMSKAATGAKPKAKRKRPVKGQRNRRTARI